VTGRERLAAATSLREPDRVPVMCQLSLGHYFLQAGLDPIDVWHSTEGFAEALVRLQRRYGFDGILVNLPGRGPDWRRHVRGIEERPDHRLIRWANGWTTVQPPDDNPHVMREDGRPFHPPFARVDPERLFYVEPHDPGGVTYPAAWGFSGEPAPPGPGFFPPWHGDTLRDLRARAGEEVALHGEVFSPFSQLLELLGYEEGLMALMDDAGRFRACLSALVEGAVLSACLQVQAGADAVLISSAFAGAGLISREHYAEFVLPFETRVVSGIRAGAGVPVYTHTCGAIGDRLDLMMATGTGGIDTLDPPPLGTVELAEARRLTAGRLFLKGNVDPVGTVLDGTPEGVRAAARERIRVAGPGGGYILSTACSVPPGAPPENVAALREAAEEWGRYPVVT
jgi:uroporphyrinogen-III decarboxylase